MDRLLFIVLVAFAAAALGYLAGRERRDRPSARALPELRPVSLRSASERSREQAAPPDDAPGGAVRSVVVLDIDGLARINAALGLDAGDRLLMRAGDLLARALPRGAAMERGDSGRFVVWLPPEMPDPDAEAERLRSLMGRALVDGPQVSGVAATVSAGLARLSWDEGRARAVLRADTALNAAKAAGGARTEAAATESGPVRPGADEVLEAIRTGTASYHVQPIYALAAPRGAPPVGFEALIRWTRTDGDPVGTELLLDALAGIEDDTVEPLVAMAEAAARPLIEAPGRPYVAFNMTGAAFEPGSGAARWIGRLLDRLPPDRILLELVEHAVLLDTAGASRAIHRLRDRGVRIALDDFGTGLSNFDRLRSLPVDLVKLDRVLIDDGDARSRALLSGLVGALRGADMSVLCEGIETEDQRRRLARIGVEYGQGYHLGRPIPVADWVRAAG